MRDFTIAIYCFLDDLVKKLSPEVLDKRRKLNDAQIITTVILAARYFYGNHQSACVYLKEHWGFNIPNKSNFNRILHHLSDLLSEIFYHLATIFKCLNLESVYIIDSFPVAICKNIRISRSKIVKDNSYRGYNASKKEFFYGVKVHIISTGSGVPVEMLITAGSVHDNAAFQHMDCDLPAHSHLYADAAYLNGEMKSLLQEFHQVKLKAATKKNSKERNTWAEELENKYYRKPVESSFSWITNFFPKKIHAVTIEGFLLKLLIAIIAKILHHAMEV